MENAVSINVIFYHTGRRQKIDESRATREGGLCLSYLSRDLCVNRENKSTEKRKVGWTEQTDTYETDEEWRILNEHRLWDQELQQGGREHVSISGLAQGVSTFWGWIEACDWSNSSVRVWRSASVRRCSVHKLNYLDDLWPQRRKALNLFRVKIRHSVFCSLYQKHTHLSHIKTLECEM